MAGTTIILEAIIGQRTRQCLVVVGAVGERDLRECSRPPIVAGRRGSGGVILRGTVEIELGRCLLLVGHSNSRQPFRCSVLC